MTTACETRTQVIGGYLAAVGELQRAAGRVVTWVEDPASDASGLWRDLSDAMEATAAAKSALDRAAEDAS